VRVPPTFCLRAGSVVDHISTVERSVVRRSSNCRARHRCKWSSGAHGTALQFAIRGVGIRNQAVLREPILRVVGPVDRRAVEIRAEPIAVAVIAVSYKRSAGAIQGDSGKSSGLIVSVSESIVVPPMVSIFCVIRPSLSRVYCSLRSCVELKDAV